MGESKEAITRPLIEAAERAGSPTGIERTVLQGYFIYGIRLEFDQEQLFFQLLPGVMTKHLHIVVSVKCDASDSKVAAQ